MINLDFIKNEEERILCLKVLESIRLYLEEAIHDNILDPTSCLRTTTVIKHLRFYLENKKVEELKISLETINEIKHGAKKEKLKYKVFSIQEAIALGMEDLTKLLSAFIKKGRTEVLEKDVDLILKTVEIINKKIEKKSI